MGDEQEVVDPMPKIRAQCMDKACPKYKKDYNACVERITKNKQGDCETWYWDWIHCADKCVAPKIFELTKE
ncbi:hypothetical protein ACA910_010961 [Epithemia clementina (nom. ined.)]